MAEGTSVGKISLGVEFEGLDEKLKALSKDLSSRLGDLSGVDFDKVTDTLEKSLKSVTESFQTNMEKVSKNISRTLTDALDAVKKKAESIEISVPKVKEEVLPQAENLVSPANRSNAPPSISPSRTKTDSLLTAQSNLNIVSRQMDMLANKADQAREKVRQIEMEMQKLSSPSGNAIEDSINTQGIERLRAELDKATQAYDNHVLKVDKAAEQYHLLEDSIARIEAERLDKAKKETEKLAKEAEKAADNIKKASENTEKLSKNTTSLGKVSNKVGGQFGKMGKMINSALKRVLIMATLYKVIRGFMSYMNSALQTNDQFSSSLAQVKSNLKVAFIPIYEAILPAINVLMAALAKATAYLAAFLSAIFGKTFAQSAKSAKALDKQKDAIAGVGGAASKAKKEADLMLAGFDEINNLAKPSADAGGGGASGSAPIIEPPDIGEIEGRLNRLFESTKKMFGKIWESAPAQAFVDAMISRFNFFKGFAATTFENVRGLAVETFNKIAPDASEGLDNLSSLFTSVFTSYSTFIDTWGPTFTEKVNGVITSIWRDVIEPAAEIITRIWKDLTGEIKDLWEEKGEKTLENIGEFVNTTIDLIQSLWDNIIAPIIEPLLNTFAELWDTHLKDTIRNVWDFIVDLYNAAMDIYNDFIGPVIDYFAKEFKPVIESVMEGVAGFLSTTVGGILDTLNGIIDALSGIIEFIAGVFTGDWDRAWEGVKSIFKGVWDSLYAIVKTPINLIINAINTMIKGLNKINIKFPDWVPGLGGKGLGFNLPEIPALAKGGIVDQPTLAMIGETRRKEAVLPLEGPNMGWMKEMAKELVAEMGMNSSGGGDIILHIDGKEVTRVAKDGINKERRMQGLPAI